MIEVTIHEDGTMVKRITVARRSSYFDCHIMEYVSHNGNYRLSSSSIKSADPNASEKQFLDTHFGITI